MSWRDYYRLIEQYGSVDAAPTQEWFAAMRANPNTPADARALAEKIWTEQHPEPSVPDAFLSAFPEERACSS